MQSEYWPRCFNYSGDRVLKYTQTSLFTSTNREGPRVLRRCLNSCVFAWYREIQIIIRKLILKENLSFMRLWCDFSAQVLKFAVILLWTFRNNLGAKTSQYRKREGEREREPTERFPRQIGALVRQPLFLLCAISWWHNWCCPCPRLRTFDAHLLSSSPASP